MEALDLRGLVPAPVTPFTRDGEVDHAAIQRLGSWLGSFSGVKGLVVLGHAGEGTFLTADEQATVIESFVKSVDGKIPVIAGITLEGTKVAALEAKRAVKAGAEAGLPISRLAPLRLSEGCTTRPLSRDLPGKWFAADPLPISGRDQSDVQPGNPA
jgi:dihydrodipicolinate synthase/N-acetylneuraminate lyase